MFLDVQESSMAIEGLISFPDFSFSALAAKPSAIKETTIVPASAGGVSLSIGGSVGQVVQVSVKPPFPGS